MGFVKFDRKIKEWGWYTDVNTFKVFFHLVLIANYTDKEFLGRVVKRGQVAIGTAKLAQEVGLTRDEVRTAIKHLELTNEITKSSQGKYTLYTITNYSSYQDTSPDTSQSFPNDFPNVSQSFPNRFPTIQEYKENKEIQEREEVVVSARAHDDCYCDTIPQEDKICPWGNDGVVKLSEKQVGKLLDLLGMEQFDYYVAKLTDFITSKNANVGGHYRLIRKWAKEDAMT